MVVAGLKVVLAGFSTDSDCLHLQPSLQGYHQISLQMSMAVSVCHMTFGCLPFTKEPLLARKWSQCHILQMIVAWRYRVQTCSCSSMVFVQRSEKRKLRKRKLCHVANYSLPFGNQVKQAPDYKADKIEMRIFINRFKCKDPYLDVIIQIRYSDTECMLTPGGTGLQCCKFICRTDILQYWILNIVSI